MIRELSTFRQVWDGMILLLIAVTCIFIPYQFAFCQDTALSGFQFIYIIDLIFLVDIGLNLFTSFRRHGLEITESRACSTHYARRMLPVDLLSSLPFDLLAWLLIGTGNEAAGTVVMALRLIRLLRVVRLFVILRRWEAFSWSNPGVLRITKVLIVTIFMIHWLACAWYVLALASGFPADSWVMRAGISDGAPLALYIYALYWTVSTMTGLGSASPPGRLVEYVFSSVVALVGVSLLAVVIGNIASLVSSIHAARVRLHERIDVVTEFLRQKRVPGHLNSMVRNYYEYRWGRHQGLDMNDMLKDIPEPLRLELMLHLASNILETVPLFKYCSPVLRNALLLSLESMTYTPGSYIAREGERGAAIYFIIEGSVEILSLEKHKSWGTMHEGDYFGFMSLMLNERRTATIKACEFCDILLLHSEDFNRIKAEFPELSEALKHASAERVEKLSELTMDGVVL